jgi:DNA-binding PadR family transcriptional regulator
MGGISEKEIALLGLLNEGPKHGYELERIIEERYMRYWTEMGFSSIYYVLKQLEKKKLIKSKKSSGKHKVTKKVYSITPDGRKILKNSLKDLFSSCGSVTVPYLLSLSNLSLMSKKQLIPMIEKRIDMISCHLELLDDAMKPFKGSGMPEPKIMESWFKHTATAEKQWLEKFKKELEGGKYI